MLAVAFTHYTFGPWEARVIHSSFVSQLFPLLLLLLLVVVTQRNKMTSANPPTIADLLAEMNSMRQQIELQNQQIEHLNQQIIELKRDPSRLTDFIVFCLSRLVYLFGIGCASRQFVRCGMCVRIYHLGKFLSYNRLWRTACRKCGINFVSSSLIFILIFCNDKEQFVSSGPSSSLLGSKQAKMD